MNLKQTILLDTPLSNHLSDHGIQFDLAHKKISYNGKIFDIGTKSYGMSATKAEIIFYKLFQDLFTSFFSFNNVLTYEGLNERPEILDDLSNLLNAPSLISDWDRNSKCYVIKFVAPISHYADWSFDKYEENEYFEQEEIDKEKSKSIITYTLGNIYSGYFHHYLDEHYSFIKPNRIIPFSNMIEIFTKEQYLNAYRYWDE